jgi:hypothetical protein
VACSLLAPAGGELLFLAIVNRFLCLFFLVLLLSVELEI